MTRKPLSPQFASPLSNQGIDRVPVEYGKQRSRPSLFVCSHAGENLETRHLARVQWRNLPGVFENLLGTLVASEEVNDDRGVDEYGHHSVWVRRDPLRSRSTITAPSSLRSVHEPKA